MVRDCLLILPESKTLFFESSHLTPYREWVHQRLSGVAEAQKSYPDVALRFSTYPNEGGIFPWGYTDNGGTMFWRMSSEQADWQLVCADEDYSSDVDLFDLSIPCFLEGWLSGRLNVRSLTPPEFFPLREASFVEYR